jgi:hypothetical protein
MTGSGSGDRSLRLLRQIVEEQHGSVRAALMLFVLRPNREDPASMARPNRDVALEMAAEAAQMLRAGRRLRCFFWQPPAPRTRSTDGWLAVSARRLVWAHTWTSWPTSR